MQRQRARQLEDAAGVLQRNELLHETVATPISASAPQQNLALSSDVQATQRFNQISRQRDELMSHLSTLRMGKVRSGVDKLTGKLPMANIRCTAIDQMVVTLEWDIGIVKK